MTEDGVDWGSTVCAALNVLREEGAFCDTTVVGNDQKTHRAHACILATASPTLKTYLKQATGNTYVVRVDHMSSSTWQCVLQFVYTGQVVITSGSSVASLSKAASTLQIRGLQMALSSQCAVRPITSKNILPEDIVMRRRQCPSHNTETQEKAATLSVSKAVGALKVHRLQTTLLSQTNLKTAAAEKPVSGEDGLEEPRVASQSDEEDPEAEAPSSMDDVTFSVRRAAINKTGAKRKRMRRLQMPARVLKTSEAVNAIEDDIRSKHEFDDDVTQTNTSRVNQLNTDINYGVESENESGDGAMQTSTSEVNKLHTAIDGDIKSDNEGGDDATETDTSNIDKPATATDTDITAHKGGDSAAETEVNRSARHRNGNNRPACLCNVCGKVLAPGSLARHMFLHADGEKPYRCDTCHAGFVAMHALRKHARVHTGEKPYRCPVCGKAFSSSATLPYHMKIHTGEKPYVCDICEVAFRSQNAMTVHRRTHTGERPYTCDVCGKSFVTANRRNRHAWMHEGRKPYHCDFCDKTYTSSTKLKVHRRTHTGEKPFMCELCGMLFSRQASMKTHVAGHSKLLQRGLRSLGQQNVHVVLDSSKMCVVPVDDIERIPT